MILEPAVRDRNQANADGTAASPEVFRSNVSSNIRSGRTRAVTREASIDVPAGDEPLRVLARAMGRQAARRHMMHGRSILEIVVLLAACAVVLAVGFSILGQTP
jgi:hypothetical protein